MEHGHHPLALTNQGSISHLQVIQGDLERANEILCVLNAARHAHKAIGDPDLETVGLLHVGVRHDLREPCGAL
mgnify:CR=1 FL=1